MKTNGLKSTEFWLSLVAMLVGFLMSSGILGAEDAPGMKIAGLVAMLLAALGYTGARTMVKKKIVEAEAVKELEKKS